MGGTSPVARGPLGAAEAEAAGGLRRRRGYLRGAFVVEHAPAGPTARHAAILVLPPLGYEDTSAYRPLRVLADTLAAKGYSVWRLDWPGLGDSAGEAETPNLFESMRAAVSEAVAALRARGHGRIIGVGVRGGALFALAEPGLDDLILWGLPASGRAWVREERAFHRMAARAFGAAPAGATPPAGALEAGGFGFSAETVLGIEGLDAVTLAARAGRGRVLLIPREGSTPAAALRSAFEASGAALTLSEAGGVGDLLEDPYRAALQPRVSEAILDWLPAEEGRLPLGPARWAPSITFDGQVRERPWIAAGGSGELSGILCEPAGGAGPGARWVIFYNAGGVRRSGPNRLWTRAARALARAGRPSLRIDVRDVGDSDGAHAPHKDLEAMYSEASIADALLAYDHAVAAGAGAVDVVGLCSGAFLGAQVAARRRVRRALLFNGLAFVWNEDAKASGMTAQIGRSLLDARRWRRLLSGRIDRVALVRSMAVKARMKAEASLTRLRGGEVESEVSQLFRLIHAQGTLTELVSSEGDPSIAYLERLVAAPLRPPLTVIPGVDHTIRPLWAHERVVALVLGEG
jgi:alpha/beta superfamily hydrolase